jgi:hypothetical protein
MERFGLLLRLALLGVAVLILTSSRSSATAGEVTATMARASLPAASDITEQRGLRARVELRNVDNNVAMRRAALRNFAKPSRRVLWWCWGSCR